MPGRRRSVLRRAVGSEEWTPRKMLAETSAASCGWFPMKTFTQNEPLTDAELDRLGDFLKSCKDGRAMNVEALDGIRAVEWR